MINGFMPPEVGGLFTTRRESGMIWMRLSARDAGILMRWCQNKRKDDPKEVADMKAKIYYSLKVNFDPIQFGVLKDDD